MLHAAIFALQCVLSDSPPVLWWLSPGEGWDAVRTNCKKSTTTKNQGSGVKYIAKGCMLDDCMYVICLDMTTTPWWREKVMVYYYYYNTHQPIY